VDVAGAVLLGEQPAVALGQAAYHVLHGAVLFAVPDQGLAEASEQPRPTTVLVVDVLAAIQDDDVGTGRRR